MQNSEPAAVSNTSIPLHQVEWKNDAPVSNSAANSMIHLYTKSILVNSHHLMGDLSSNFNHHPIDPGHIHANRLANYSTLDNTLFFINHKKLFKIRYELPSEAKWRATKNEKLPYPIPLSEIDMACVYEGQEQFQDVEIDGHRMGVCDEVGNVHVLERDASLLGHVDDEEDGARGKKRKLDASSIVKLPYNVGGEETTIRGHCSMRFHPRDEHIIFRSKFSTKHVTIFDMNKNATVFNIHTLQNPTKIKTFEMDNSSSPLLAIGEYNNVSIWDLRTNKSVERLTRTRGIVYDLEVCHTGNTDNKFKSSNLLGTVGSDRTVYVYDTKKWSPVHKWQNCLKYAVSFIVTLNFFTMRYM